MLSPANQCRRGRFIPGDAFDHGNVQKAQRKEPFAVAKTFTGSVTTVSPTSGSRAEPMSNFRAICRVEFAADSLQQFLNDSLADAQSASYLLVGKTL